MITIKYDALNEMSFFDYYWNVPLLLFLFNVMELNVYRCMVYSLF